MEACQMLYAVWRNSEGLLGSKGMRRDNIRVRMVAVRGRF